jgi:glycosyltransferase involved in cell wall biosynthesis
VWNVLKHKCIKDNRAASALIMIESTLHKALRVYDRYTDLIITPSRFYRDKLIEWGWAPEKLVHVRNFVPLAPTPPPFTPGDHLLYFGRLSHEKGLATLIRAAALSGVPVRIAGRGPEEERLRALVAETNAPVEFLGFRADEALWAAVDAARAVVLPSEWYENGPMSAIEAFGRGKPLLGAAIGGIPELIIEGVTGWTFRPGDVEDLAARMTGVMALPAGELAVMYRETRARALTEYAPDVYYQTMLDLYRPLIAASGMRQRAALLP